MKAFSKMIFACTFALFCCTAFSFGGDGCCSTSSCVSCEPECCPYDTPCECTDYGYRYNNCISKCDYCEAFGNVGGR